VKYLPLFHHFKAINFQNIFFLVKIVANASLKSKIIHFQQIKKINILKVGWIKWATTFHYNWKRTQALTGN
jgi:hypothetical protein